MDSLQTRRIENRYSHAMLLIDKPYAKAYIYTINNCIIFELKWIGFVESQDFRATLDEALPYVYQFKPTHWLGNNRKMRVISPTDQEWTSGVWFPKLVQNKFEKMAIVESEDMFNKRGVSKIISKAESVITFDTRYFSTAEQAIAWLTEGGE